MLKIIFLLLFSFTFVNCSSFVFGRSGNRQAVFEKFDGTCGRRDLVIVMKLTSIRVEGTKVYMNGTFTVSQDINKDPKMVVYIDRCKNKESLDTCEPFHVYTTDSYCAAGATFAKDFMKVVVPEWKCPIKKGIYRATNAEVDALFFFIFPVESWYWKVQVNVKDKDTNRMLMCVAGEARMTRM